jgi:tellurite resistance protein TerC
MALWVTFGLVVACMLAFDLGVFQKTAREPTTKEALAWSGIWLALASAFGLGVGAVLGPAKSLEFFTAYLVEQALSVDNLFVMMLVFAQLAVPRTAQRRVLVWGILGAIVLRGAFVLTGTALVTRFHFLTYAMGALLVVAAVKLLRETWLTADDRLSGPDAEAAPRRSRVRALLGSVLPITDDFAGARFTVVKNGIRHATPLLLALVTIELADAVFALDSIPAVFGVTTDPLVVFTSNLFAVLGLRSMFLRERRSARRPARAETILVVTDGEPDDQRAVIKTIIAASRRVQHDEELAVTLDEAETMGLTDVLLSAIHD